jgi:hypothetical protein
MNESNGYGEDMYSSGDFNEAPGQVRCSKCHRTSHTAATHDKHMKAMKVGRQNASPSGPKRRKVLHVCLWTLHVLLFIFSNIVLLLHFFKMAPPSSTPFLTLRWTRTTVRT